MDTQKQKNVWMSVPQFGGWDHKGEGANYSMVFSQARANRKQQKNDVNRASLRNEREFIAAHYRDNIPNHHLHQPQDDSVVRKKKILTYINCCIKP